MSRRRHLRAAAELERQPEREPEPRGLAYTIGWMLGAWVAIAATLLIAGAAARGAYELLELGWHLLGAA